MEDFIFHQTTDADGIVIGIELSGMLVLDHAQSLKKEFLNVILHTGKRLKIAISSPEEIDLSFIQLFVSFIQNLDEINVLYRIDWTLDEDQKILLERVGLSNELFLIN